MAALLRAGDVVILTGELGAGKTTLVQGLAEALGVRGPITSPTFVLARIHPSLVGGPALVHVDVYRLDGALEVDDLDLDAEMSQAVTVVEWGEGRAEHLSQDRLDITLSGWPERTATLRATGPRWEDPQVQAALTQVARAQVALTQVPRAQVDRELP